MNTKQLAALLNGTEYPLRISNELSKQAAEHGLVIVYGASDDLIEFAGAINDEHGAWEGGQYLLDKKGILPDYDDIDQESEMEDYMARKNNVAVINSLWCKTDKYSFTYETDIPHEKFDVVEDDGFYCQGIVFDINKLEEPTLLIYDTETTGLPNWKTPSGGDDQPHMVQIAAILCNAETGQAIKTMNVIVKPDGWTIPQETIDVHGITNEYALEHGIPEKEAIQQLLDLRGNAERVAYNKTFDQRIVRIGLKRFFDEPTQEKWAIKDDHHCAMRMAQKVIGGKNPKLVEAFKHFTGKEMTGAHDAMQDTLGCMAVYFAIVDSEKED